MNNNESNSNEGYEWPIVVRNSSRHSNLDYYYGPYDSYEDMEANVPSTVRDFGFTAAVHNADGSVTEYWLVGTSKSNLKWQQKYVQFNEAISVKGSVSSLEELEAKTDNKVGDMYLIKNDDGTYSEYIWVEDSEGNGHWELLGTESTMMKGTLSFKGVTPTADDGNACDGYNGSQNVTVDMSGFASRSALSTATSGLSNQISNVRKSVSCRNYALKTYIPITHTTTSLHPVDSNGNFIKDSNGNPIDHTLYFYKAITGNAACKKGTKITVSFDYDIKIQSGSFNVNVHRTWNNLFTPTEDMSGHFSKTITLGETITDCEKYGLVYIQGIFIGSCTISNFKWELGDTETEWCPASEDFKDVITISDNGQLESNKFDIPQIGYSIKDVAEGGEVFRDISIGWGQMMVSYGMKRKSANGITFFIDDDTSKKDYDRNYISIGGGVGYAGHHGNGFTSLLNPLIYYARFRFGSDGTVSSIKQQWDPYNLNYSLSRHYANSTSSLDGSELCNEGYVYPAGSTIFVFDIQNCTLSRNSVLRKLTILGNARYLVSGKTIASSYVSYIDSLYYTNDHFPKGAIAFVVHADNPNRVFGMFEMDVFIYAFGR